MWFQNSWATCHLVWLQNKTNIEFSLPKRKEKKRKGLASIISFFLSFFLSDWLTPIWPWPYNLWQCAQDNSKSVGTCVCRCHYWVDRLVSYIHVMALPWSPPSPLVNVSLHTHRVSPDFWQKRRSDLSFLSFFFFLISYLPRSSSSIINHTFFVSRARCEA